MLIKTKLINLSIQPLNKALRLFSVYKPLNMDDLKDADFASNAKFFEAKKTPMLPKDTFKGRVAFVTGGGTGLGKNMAQMLSNLGAKVFITSRREEVLKKAAQEITANTGNEVAYFPADVRNPEQIEKSLEACISSFKNLPTIVINNAAGNFISPTERLSPNAIKAIIDIVLLGTLNTTLIIGKRLIKEGKGASFLSIATTYAEVGSAFVVPSACAKSGIVAMTRSLAVEWSKYGMRFNAISPGPIYTEGAFSRLDPTGAFTDKAQSRIPAGRLGQQEELSNLACYLLSDYSNWMNGQVVNFDGGELTNMSGEFNYLYGVEKSQWDMMEQMIRSSNKKSKM